jgi:hypothetical protein
MYIYTCLSRILDLSRDFYLLHLFICCTPLKQYYKFLFDHFSPILLQETSIAHPQETEWPYPYWPSDNQDHHG